MAKFLVTKHMNALRAVDDAGEAMLGKLTSGHHYMIEIKRPRNIEFFRLYWVLMNLVWQQTDTERWPTVEDFSDSVKITAGLRRSIFLPSGDVVYSPGSIAFRNMDQLTFDAFFERVCDVIAREYLPGVTTDALYEEVAFIVGASFMPTRKAA
jgi:hypothetical protein